MNWVTRLISKKAERSLSFSFLQASQRLRTKLTLLTIVAKAKRYG